MERMHLSLLLSSVLRGRTYWLTTFISTEEDSVSSFEKKKINHETNLRHKNTFWRLTKRIRKELREEKTFFLFSAKDLDLVNFSKNSKDT